jgi:hypothetical protein
MAEPQFFSTWLYMLLGVAVIVLGGAAFALYWFLGRGEDE